MPNNPHPSSANGQDASDDYQYKNLATASACVGLEELFEKKRVDRELSGLDSQAYRRRRVMNGEMRPDDEQWSRLLRLGTVDAEFALGYELS